MKDLLNMLHILGEDQLSELLEVNARTLRNWASDAQVAKPLMVQARLEQIQEKIRNPPKKIDSKFTFIDLFAGIGGIRRGFESVGGECIFTSEWDKYSQKTYRANFKDDHLVLGDITKIPTSLIPNHDLLVAGFPCQPFSLAGVSKKNSMGVNHGFGCNTQGTLFFEIERILAEKKPKAFLLENVKNLISHDKGNTFKVIMDTLEKKLNYKVSYKIIDANGFVPQHRQRIYIVGFRDINSFNWDEFNQPPKGSLVLSDILHSEDGNEIEEPPYTIGPNANVSSTFTISEKLWQYLINYKKKHELQGNGFGYSLVNSESVTRTLSARYHKDGSEILIDQGENNRPRKLTPRECARLMGYPDEVLIPVSNTQAYRQFGNSVVVPVISEIARIMLKHIL